MTALLHYFFLKGRRDHSLAIFVFAPAVLITVALLGASVVQQRLRYPLMLAANMSLVQNDALAETVFGTMAIGFATISAFWMLRAEIATKAVNSFVVASSTTRMSAALIQFAAMTGIASWLVATGAVIVLTGTIPPHLPMIAVAMLAAAYALAAIGALTVAISPQPMMMAWACSSLLLFIRWADQPADRNEFLLAGIVFVICAGLSTYRLGRRCAA